VTSWGRLSRAGKKGDLSHQRGKKWVDLGEMCQIVENFLDCRNPYDQRVLKIAKQCDRRTAVAAR